MASLGDSLFSELAPRFFGLLSGLNARVYLDVVDALEREMPTRGEAMERVEVTIGAWGAGSCGNLAAGGGGVGGCWCALHLA